MDIIVNNFDYVIVFIAGVIVSIALSLKTIREVYKEHKYGTDEMDKIREEILKDTQ